jgi:hypothetical protein
MLTVQTLTKDQARQAQALTKAAAEAKAAQATASVALSKYLISIASDKTARNHRLTDDGTTLIHES